MPTATATQAKAARKPQLGEITVILDGGLIQNVKFPPELEGLVTIRVEDEDVEGADAEDIQRDADGREYYLTQW